MLIEDLTKTQKYKSPMKKFMTGLLCVGALTLQGCFKTKETTTSTDTPPKATAGGRYYGGTFRLNETEYIKNLFPHSIVDVYSYRIASQIYEGLFKFDHTSLKVVNSLAESYTIDDAHTTYTIKLKKGVMFHDDECFDGGKGRELKATDIKYCFTKLCTQDRNNQGFSVFYGILKGAKEYYDASKGGNTPTMELSGIKVIDDYTVQLTLEKPNSLFLTHLARPQTFIFPKEAYEKYGMEMRIKCVGTGAYKLAQVDDDIAIILKKNPNYHTKDKFGNQLPFLDAINIQFIKDKKTELFEFKKGNLDMMYRLPTDYIIEILEETTTDTEGKYSKYELQREPEMQTQLFAFNTQTGIFANADVRKAFSYAIDREKILDFVLNGEGYAAGLHGITPPSFSDYDISKIPGYNYNPDSARYFLKKAGFAQGKGFPKVVLDFNAEGDRHTNVAVEVQKQLKDVLNVDLDFNMIPIAQIAEKCMSGNFQLIRLSWVADYPSPENFLSMWSSQDVPTLAQGGSSYPNIPRYVNKKYDELYQKALNASSDAEALKYFMQGESLAMRDAPILALWYDEGYRLLQSKVRNFPNNPMQYRDFSEVYFEPENTQATK
jgi:peptide/nickel transport system substrate-binding protein